MPVYIFLYIVGSQAIVGKIYLEKPYKIRSDHTEVTFDKLTNGILSLREIVDWELESKIFYLPGKK